MRQVVRRLKMCGFDSKYVAGPTVKGLGQSFVLCKANPNSISFKTNQKHRGLSGTISVYEDNTTADDSRMGDATPFKIDAKADGWLTFNMASAGKTMKENETYTVFVAFDEPPRIMVCNQQNHYAEGQAFLQNKAPKAGWDYLFKID